MPRHEHEVNVVGVADGQVRLSCHCGWISDALIVPTVSRLAEIAQAHRREASR